jgi:hypothetical protein
MAEHSFVPAERTPKWPTIVLKKEATLFGRGASADVRTNDVYISRIHARFSICNDGRMVAFTYLGSAENLCHVDGRWLKKGSQVFLSPGATINLAKDEAKYRFRYQRKALEIHNSAKEEAKARRKLDDDAEEQAKVGMEQARKRTTAKEAKGHTIQRDQKVAAATFEQDTEDNLEPCKMKVAMLREELEKRGFDTAGCKAELVQRLTHALSCGSLAKAESDADDDEDVDEFFYERYMYDYGHTDVKPPARTIHQKTKGRKRAGTKAAAPATSKKAKAESAKKAKAESASATVPSNNKPKTLPEKIVESIRRAREVRLVLWIHPLCMGTLQQLTRCTQVVQAADGTCSFTPVSRVQIVKVLAVDFGVDHKAGMKRAFQKVETEGWVEKMKSSFRVVGDAVPAGQQPDHIEMDDEDEEHFFIPPSFAKHGPRPFIEVGKKKHPVSDEQWSEWLEDPDCEGAEYGACMPNEAMSMWDCDGCWMHDNFGGGYYGDESGDEGELVDTIDCPDCHLAQKMRAHVGL